MEQADPRPFANTGTLANTEVIVGGSGADAITLSTADIAGSSIDLGARIRYS